MTRINYKSDFSILEKFHESKDGGAVQVSVPDAVRIEYTTPSERGKFIAQRKGDSFLNCALTEDGMALVVFLSLSRREIGTGILKRNIVVFSDDADYPEDVKITAGEQDLNIELITGISDDDITVTDEIILLNKGPKGDTGDKGDKGEQGDTGPAGTGVDDIKIDQSTESGGKSVVTVELTDGTAKSFDVYNGIDGTDYSDAEAARVEAETLRVQAEALRADAEAGRATAEDQRAAAESVRNANETDRIAAETARATAEASRALAETSRAAAEDARVTAETAREEAETAREEATKEAVADAENAADRANSAAAVKLYDMHSFLNDIGISEYYRRNYCIDILTGKWCSSSSGPNYAHVLVSVIPGQAVTIVQNPDYFTRYAWLTASTVTASAAAPLLPGTSAMTAEAGETVDLVVPEGAVYLYVYAGALNYSEDRGNALPSKVLVGWPPMAAEYSEPDYIVTEVDLSAVPEQECGYDGYIWKTTGTHGRIPVDPGDILRVTAGEASARVCLTSMVRAAYINYAVGGSMGSWLVPAGGEIWLRCTDDAVSMIYEIKSHMDGETDRTPVSITIFKPRALALNDAIKGGVKVIEAAWWGAAGGLIFNQKTPYGDSKYYYSWAMFKCRGGVRYDVDLYESALTGWCIYVDSLPYIGQSYTVPVTMSDVSASGTTTRRLAFTAPGDGYILIRTGARGSSAPTLRINGVYEALKLTDDTAPLSDRLDASANLTDSVSKYGAAFLPINPLALTRWSYYIIPNGVYNASNSYKHIRIPVTQGTLVRVIRNSVYSAVCAWLASDAEAKANGLPDYAPGTGRFSVSDEVLRAPEGAAFLYVYLGLGSSEYPYAPSYIGIAENLPLIVKRNEPLKTQRILGQLNGRTRNEQTSGNQSYIDKPLVLLHYSDVHGVKDNQTRINQYRNYWKDYIDDTVQTGDAANTYAEGSALEVDPEGCKDILSVLGNHDTYRASTSNWHEYQGLPAYEKFFKPYIDNWGVVQPEGAEDNGYCFWYKDYTGSRVRLIGIDAFNTDTNYKAYQQQWFADILADAIEQNLSVVVASHYGIKSERLINCPFSNPGASVATPDTAYVNDPYVAMVKDFKDAGGDFVCWLAGHSHYDAVTVTSEETGKQVCIRVGAACASGSYGNSVLRLTNNKAVYDVRNSRTFDLFNIVSIDVPMGRIVLFRVGSDYDKYGRHIETCSIRFRIGKMEWPQYEE